MDAVCAHFLRSGLSWAVVVGGAADAVVIAVVVVHRQHLLFVEADVSRGRYNPRATFVALSNAPVVSTRACTASETAVLTW